jgi:hypothetical protein
MILPTKAPKEKSESPQGRGCNPKGAQAQKERRAQASQKARVIQGAQVPKGERAQENPANQIAKMTTRAEVPASHRFNTRHQGPEK